MSIEQALALTLGVVIFGVVLSRALRLLGFVNPRSRPTHPGPDAPGAQPGTDSPEALIGEGRLIDAIKALRELRPNRGLKEAKEAVDHFREQGRWPEESPRPFAALPVAGDAEIEALLRAGRKVEAIQALRARVPHLGLKEAKEAVDALSAGL